jgi:hypothetical protein
MLCKVRSDSVLCYASCNADFGNENCAASQLICHITVKTGERNVKSHLISTRRQIIFVKMNIGLYDAAFVCTNVKP